MGDESDQELTAQLKKGRLEALGILYDRYRLMVYRTALAISGDPESANDLTQDVFLRLNRFSSRIDDQRPLDSWLYRMTVNLAYTWVKRNRRLVRPIGDLLEWLTGTEKNSPDEVIETDEEFDRVWQALKALPVSQRIVLVLYYIDDLSLQKISGILDVPVGTVKSRLFYGRQALQKSITQQGGTVSDWNYERT